MKTTNQFYTKKNSASKPYEKYQNFSNPQNCNFCNENKSCESCPRLDLCKHNILIIGGVERMEVLYRDLIEKNGGILDYHSGSMQSGTKKLEKRLQRADLIICPINCNSHTACIKVKNLAKKFEKNFHMLPTGSISSIKSLFERIYA